MSGVIPASVHDDVEILWVYLRLGHELRHTDVGVGLGSHDIGVAVRTAELYKRSLFSLMVFTGANAPTTIDRFPRGEAVHYRERALAKGVPDEAIRVESKARNTGENMTLTRDLLRAEGITPKSVMLISRPYQERRAYATCRKLWPEVEVVCTSQQVDLDTYAAGIGDIPRMINVMVGDTQRIRLHAERGYAIPQDMPDEVQAAYERLVAAGYTAHLIPEAA
ncbi:MAG: YdcF family protein [Actinophytocola sp.]|uniref:YdcF family protein n=1 Tax=Actinophytocola sp. TaxID=1872138 RepID=UPI003C794C01